MLSKRMLLPIMLLPMLLLALGWSSAAQAAPCEPDASGWQPTRYYTAGAAVFHDGQWYQARQINEGKEPGISFDWKKLKAAPECDSAQTQKQQAAEKPRTKTKALPAPGTATPTCVSVRSNGDSPRATSLAAWQPMAAWCGRQFAPPTEICLV